VGFLGIASALLGLCQLVMHNKSLGSLSCNSKCDRRQNVTSLTAEANL
jgi:hypothetical protein